MILLYWLAGMACSALFVYLLAALWRAEEF